MGFEHTRASSYLPATRTLHPSGFLTARTCVPCRSLRDLVDSGDDKADVLDAITALGRIVAVLQPMLKHPPSSLIGSAGSALELLGSQLRAKNHMSGVELASDLESCISNLYALTHRSKGLGDQAKESIRAIVERGTFVFVNGELRVSCANGAKFAENGLSDLRRHALLGICDSKQAAARPAATPLAEDAETQRAIEMAIAGNATPRAEAASGGDDDGHITQQFLRFIEASESICASISELRMLGHFGVYRFSLRVDQAEPLDRLSELQRLQREKARECVEWQAAVRDARQRYYMLSFYSSRQLWELYTLLCTSSEILCGRAASIHLLRYVPAVRPPVPQMPRGQRQGSSSTSLPPQDQSASPQEHTARWFWAASDTEWSEYSAEITTDLEHQLQAGNYVCPVGDGREVNRRPAPIEWSPRIWSRPVA